ncbi:MAG: VCBS repeat-containing protein [Acidobacteriota bacterium]
MRRLGSLLSTLVITWLAGPAMAGLPSTPTLQADLADVSDFGFQVLVIPLTDDDGDGDADLDDVPDMVSLGTTLTAVDGLTGDELFSVIPTPTGSALAAADIDGDGWFELLVAGGRLTAYEHTGEIAWDRPWPTGLSRASFGLADIDHDGVPEAYFGPNVVSLDDSWGWFDGTLSSPRASVTHVADLLPESPGLELFLPPNLWRADGTIAWSVDIGDDPFLRHATSTIADLDGDGDPEIVVSPIPDVRAELVVLDHLGNELGGYGTLPGHGEPRPIFSVDVDADGVTEVLHPLGDELLLLQWDGTGLVPRWSHPTNDSSCCAGATAYDFDGDELPEILYQDQESFLSLEGRTGALLFRDALLSGTGVERPLVVDVDADDAAEILVGATSDGLRVYEVACSTTPLGLWNQRDYHGTNIDRDGSIPQVEAPAWTEGRSWDVQSTTGQVCGLTGFETLEPIVTCPGEEVVLDASAITGCEGVLSLEWSEAGETLGTEPLLRVTADSDRLITLTAECSLGPCCIARSIPIELPFPGFTSSSALDLSPCLAGLDLSWLTPPRAGSDSLVVNVYRSVGPDASCDDALSRPPVAAGLDTTSWRDELTIPGEPHLYVLEVEAFGTGCDGVMGPAGGVVQRACLEPVIDWALDGESGRLPTVASCDGEIVWLDASHVFPECALRSFSWFEEGVRVGGGSVLSLTPTNDTIVEVVVRCGSGPGCEASFLADVLVERLPQLGPAIGRDVEDCGTGVLLRWTPATFSDPMVGGVYHVYRSDSLPPSCEDALARPPVAVGLTETLFRDETTLRGQEHVYVIAAEDGAATATSCPAGPVFGGLVGTTCLDPIIDVAAPLPDGVGPPLRAANDDEEVTFLWPTARALEDGEAFVLLKALDHPTEAFARVVLTGPDARSFTETDTSSPRQFFDLRVETCAGLSADEYPPGP